MPVFDDRVCLHRAIAFCSVLGDQIRPRGGSIGLAGYDLESAKGLHWYKVVNKPTVVRSGVERIDLPEEFHSGPFEQVDCAATAFGDLTDRLDNVLGQQKGIERRIGEEG